MYGDEDSFSSEIAELYSYTEGPEFALAQKAFEDAAEKFKMPNTWRWVEKPKVVGLSASLRARIFL